MKNETELNEIIKKLEDKLEDLEREVKLNKRGAEYDVKELEALKKDIYQKNRIEFELQSISEELKTFFYIYKKYNGHIKAGVCYTNRNMAGVEAESIRTIITAFNNKFKEEGVK
jgi:hypothetical protein